MSRGIIILATGEPYYGRVARNLAVTIKATEDFPVAILWKGRALSHLSRQQLEIFDQLIEIDSDGFSAKVRLFDLSPFDETLYIDADTAWLPYRKPSDLFEELKDVDFTGITEGYFDLDNGDDQANNFYHFWCSPAQAKELHGLSGKLYQWRSEVLYFKKSELTRQLFDLANEIYKDPKVDAKLFAGNVPDELAFNIAACKLNIHPHVFKWKPTYWHRLHGEGMSLPSIAADYYLLSAGGNFASSVMKTCYNNVCMAAHKKLGLQYLFTLQSKKSVIRDRLKM